MNFFKHKSNKERTKLVSGFTLIEIIVSLAVFSVVAVVALGALTKIVDANKKAQTLQAAISNLNFAMESMSREMRVGANYNCQSSSLYYPGNSLTAHNCGALDQTQSGAAIAFISSKRDSGNTCNLVISYRFRYDSSSATWALEKAQQSACNSPIVEGDYASVIDPGVMISGYRIQVTGGTYPLALIRVTGYAGVREKEKTYFDLQTAISSRTVL